MKKAIPKNLYQLLLEVVQARRPDRFEEIAKGDIKQMSEETRFDIRQALTDEFASTGLGADSEPNARGYQLEELIDYLA